MASSKRLVSKIASLSQGCHRPLHGYLPQEGVISGRAGVGRLGGRGEGSVGMWMKAGNLGLDPFLLFLPQPSCIHCEPLYSLIHGITVKISVFRTSCCLGQSAVKATCVHTGLWR